MGMQFLKVGGIVVPVQSGGIALEVAAKEWGVSAADLEASYRSVWPGGVPTEVPAPTPLHTPAPASPSATAAASAASAASASDAVLDPETPKDPAYQARLAEVYSYRFADRVTPEQWACFVADATAMGWDPTAYRQVMPVVSMRYDADGIPREEVNVLVRIEALRLAAMRTGTYVGSDDFTFEKDEAGRLVSATAVVYRLINGERVRFSRSATWKEFYGHLTDGSCRAEPGASVVEQKPQVCLSRCAEAIALRAAFPEACGGVYAPEEITSRPPTARTRTTKPAEPTSPLEFEMDVPTSRFGFELALIDLGVGEPEARAKLIADCRRAFPLLEDESFWRAAWSRVRRVVPRSLVTA